MELVVACLHHLHSPDEFWLETPGTFVRFEVQNLPIILMTCHLVEVGRRQNRGTPKCMVAIWAEESPALKG